MPWNSANTRLSCIIARLALSPAMTWSTGTCMIGAKISRSSVRPVSPP